MRPACDYRHAIETDDQRVALAVFIKCGYRTLGNCCSACLFSTGQKWDNCVLLTPSYTEAFVCISAFTHTSAAHFPAVLGELLTVNSKAGRFCLLTFAPCVYDAFCSLKCWQKQSPILWELREPTCLATVFPFRECSGDLDARLLLSILSNFCS